MSDFIQPLMPEGARGGRLSGDAMLPLDLETGKPLDQGLFSAATTPKRARAASFEYAGDLGPGHDSILVTEMHKLQELRDVKEHPKLGQWSATSIAGNDLLSSCLYVSGLTAVQASYLSPIVLLLVSLVLACYRSIYAEVVTALPKNGGVFNALIHTSTKGSAAFASCLSLLSYIATGVVSATAAIHYLFSLIEVLSGQQTTLPFVPMVVGLLLLFAILCFMGLKESAVVALLIFFTHIICLCLLVGGCSVYAFRTNWQQLRENIALPLPVVQINGAEYTGIAASIFMGYSTALLGISGFESSSQFVEEQKPGVFRKTLRNMLVSVAFFNPLISLLSFAVLPYQGGPGSILGSKETLLAQMAAVAVGNWLKIVMNIDAFIVLSGAVLTAYVGVNGLIRQIASDRCLPQFFLIENKWRGTNHYIIFGFFLVSSSLLIVLKGDETTLAGVYTYAFLGVMLTLGFACIMLNVKRPDIPREEKASSFAIFGGIVGVAAGMLGNILGQPGVLQSFVLYFVAVALVMACMYYRTRFLKLLNMFMQKHLPCCKMNRCIERTIDEINKQQILFFARKADLVLMNKAVLYVRDNEQTSIMTFVHIEEPGDEDTGFRTKFASRVAVLDNLYPKIRINSLVVQGGKFDFAMIRYLEDKMKVPQNYMFISSPASMDMTQLGGLRVITR